MSRIVLMIVILASVVGIVGCATAAPATAPTAVTEATATPLVVATPVATMVAPTEVPTTAVTAAATEVATTAAATAAPAATAATGGGTGTTAGTLAQAGQSVYNTSCAICHGEKGEGVTAPAIMGSAANLAKYSTGKGLYDYVHQAMPLTAPSSLTDEQYLQVVCYLLVQNNDVDANATVGQSSLAQIQLK